MKKTISIILTTLCITASSMAVDRIVAEGGQGGAYATINDAISAAVSGDRIMIYPKANGAMYSENITITNKSLQLLSATEGTQWKLNGTITFNPSAAGTDLTVHLAHIVVGDITTGINAPAGTRCKVNVLGCTLNNGEINFNGNNFDCHIAQNTLDNGRIVIRYGKILGNTVYNGGGCNNHISVGQETTGTNDVVYIVGNYVNMYNTNCGTTTAGISFNSTAFYYYIANNFVDTDITWQIGIHVQNSKTGSGKNVLYNNSILHNGSNNNWGIYVVNCNSPTEVFNNSIATGGVATYAFGLGTNSVNAQYGYNFTSLSGANAYNNITNDGTNLAGVTFTMNATTGEVTSGPQIDGGSPDNAFLDLDLTRNNADCYGGSYSRSNFTNVPTGAVTTFMIAPRRVLAGETINISAEGFDR